MIAAVALGSNLASRFGEREQNLSEAVKRLRALGNVVAVSSSWDTAPVGNVDQGRFLNGALLLDSELGAVELMRGLLAVERGMGRERGGVAAKGPRVIDLDLLFYGDVAMESAELTLPHPAMREREFVLGPLEEIAPDWINPLTGQTVTQMLEQVRRTP